MIGTVTREAEGTTERSLCRPPEAAYWLITKTANGRVQVLTFDGKKTLPVFSSEDEAEKFLRFDGVADGWQVSESSGGELVSMLYGLCAGVGKVALDPLPEMVADRTLGLVSLDRKRFIRRLLARRRFCELERGSSPREVERRSEASDHCPAPCGEHRMIRTPLTELGFGGGVTVVRLQTRDDHWGRYIGDRCPLGEEFLLEVF